MRYTDDIDTFNCRNYQHDIEESSVSYEKMGDKTFNLTWNNHLANLSGLFEGLYRSGSLTDTTLACQGGMLRAHRLVLAACSPYFERVFKEHYGEQPILILKGKWIDQTKVES